ncbi:MAG: calcium-binding protein [Spirochaetaceae bacterium]|nr:calcium-binding protein [Spirochaetaceae bacterium]
MSDNQDPSPQNNEQEEEQTPVYRFSNASELIIGSEDGEEIHARGGSDVVLGEGGDDTIYGGAGSDFLFGGSGDDSIEGGTGGDLIMGGSGDDTLSGGGGRDIIRGGSGADTIDGGAGADLLIGGSGDDDITGGEGGDFILGGAGADTIDGGAGADIIVGGSGDDTLTGGAGADIFAFGPGDGNDTITDFNKDEDTINLSMFGADLSYSDLTITATTDGTGTIITVPGNGEDDDGTTITLQGVTSTDVTESMFEFSNAGDDTITGTAADEIITGGSGDDTMSGGGGSDTFVFAPGDGDDTITDFSTSDDKIDLTAFGEDVSYSDLTIAATTDGTGTVITLPGEDGGTITLQGVTSTDLTADQFVFASAVTRGTLFVGSEADSGFTGTGFSDTIIGGEGDDTLAGGGGNDVIFGNEGDDTITGGAGNDAIFGGGGDDTINAGSGSNYVRGGAGADTFVVEAGQTVTTIGDFTDGEDQIDLSNLSGITGFSDLTITDDNGTAVIDLSSQGAGTIRLSCVAAADLAADDFVFAGSSGQVDDGM